ncbi:FkbM family methyltransferase [bacterium]|nr:FkbM family methyltransferase [bacterium]
MLKKLARSIVSTRQYEQLSILKNRLRSTLLSPQDPSGFTEQLVTCFGQPEWRYTFLKSLPNSLKLAIKPEIEIVSKLDYEKREILLSIDSEIEYGIRVNSCKKEPETVNWIETLIHKGEVLYDIGANVGTYSLVAAKFWQHDIEIYAFEPSFVNFAQLCKNVVLNRCSDCLYPLQIGLSDRTGIEIFNYQNLKAGGALSALGEPIDWKGDEFQPVFTQHLLSYKIDDLVSQLNLPIPNHLKIDVDGIELAILHGASRTLEHESVRSLLIEIEEGDREATEIVEFLRSKGFGIQSKHRYVHGGENSPFANVYNYIFWRGDT